jgi:TPR repeat protein
MKKWLNLNCLIIFFILCCNFTYAQEKLKELESFKKGSAQARLDLAKQYLNEGDEAGQKEAARLLRSIVINEEENYLIPAFMMLKEIRDKIRYHYPEVNDNEYKKAGGSLGEALKNKGEIDKSIDALIEEAGTLSSDAQIRLEILYMYHVDGYPQDDVRILKYYQESASEGLPRSQFFLGNIYKNGWGVKKDERAGQEFLKLSDWKRRGFRLH